MNGAKCLHFSTGIDHTDCSSTSHFPSRLLTLAVSLCKLESRFRGRVNEKTVCASAVCGSSSRCRKPGSCSCDVHMSVLSIFWTSALSVWTNSPNPVEENKLDTFLDLHPTANGAA